MNAFIERGRSEKEVRALIRRKYGNLAKIMSRREYREGGFLGLFSRKMVELSGYTQQTVFTKREAQKGDRFQANKEELLQSLNQEKSQPHYKKILEEFRELRSELNEKLEASRTVTEKHPAVDRVSSILRDNEFTEEISSEIEEMLVKKFTLEELENHRVVDLCVFRWLSEHINECTYSNDQKTPVTILIGPTGVGKTTTIAKLAALYGMKYKEIENIRLITIDNYRIGAVEQIKTYGKIMNIPVFTADSAEALKKIVTMFDDNELLFIDTIGKSPNDFQHLGSMRAVLGVCIPKAHVALCISATTKLSDAREIIRQYDIFTVGSVIVTKLDETAHVGEVLSLLIESQKPLSYITVGQKVPSDIFEGGKVRLLERIHGFSLQRDEIQSIIERADIEV